MADQKRSEMMKENNKRFAKLRDGVFKEADELSKLCGADVAIMLLSPEGKPYSYGNPSFDAVLERYLAGSSGGSSSETSRRSVCVDASAISDANAASDKAAEKAETEQAMLETSQAYLESLEKELEAEKARGEMLKERLRKTREQNNIKDVKDLNLEELVEFKSKLEALRDMINGGVVESAGDSSTMMLSEDDDDDDVAAESDGSESEKTE